MWFVGFGGLFGWFCFVYLDCVGFNSTCTLLWVIDVYYYLFVCLCNFGFGLYLGFVFGLVF